MIVRISRELIYMALAPWILVAGAASLVHCCAETVLAEVDAGDGGAPRMAQDASPGGWGEGGSEGGAEASREAGDGLCCAPPDGGVLAACGSWACGPNAFPCSNLTYCVVGEVCYLGTAAGLVQRCAP
jgi:hypothetical protein